MDALPTPKRQALQAANFSLFSPLTTTIHKPAEKKMTSPLVQETSSSSKKHKKKKSKSKDLSDKVVGDAGEVSTGTVQMMSHNESLNVDSSIEKHKKHKKSKRKKSDLEKDTSNVDGNASEEVNSVSLLVATHSNSDREDNSSYKKQKKSKKKKYIDIESPVRPSNDNLLLDIPTPGSPSTPEMGSPVSPESPATPESPAAPVSQDSFVRPASVVIQPTRNLRYKATGFSECAASRSTLCAEDIQGKELWLISMPKHFDASVLDKKSVIMNSALRVAEDKEQGGHWELQATSYETNVCGGNVTVLLPSKTDRGRLKSVGCVNAHLNIVKTIPVSPYVVPESIKSPPQMPEGLKCRHQPFGSTAPPHSQLQQTTSSHESSGTKSKKKQSKHNLLETSNGVDPSSPSKKKRKKIKVEPE